MTDVETYLDKLVLSQPLRDPAIQHAIRALGLPEGSRGLDAGCGTGSHTLLLAEVVGLLWGEMQSKISQADREEYRRLADPESPDHILDSPDYYASITYSIFEGRVARDWGK